MRRIVGVSTGPPKMSIVEYPTSSQMMKRMFGAFSGAVGCTNGVQSGVASRISTANLPFHGSGIVAHLR
jgi:hypothetical protein